jgi:hypothetical protein
VTIRLNRTLGENEWLLIDIERINERTRVPLTGRLLLHSARKEDLSKAFMSDKGRLYRVFSGPALPAGFAAAF